MNKRIDYLDSLRGLASFSVVICHFIGSFEYYGYMNQYPNVPYFLLMIFNGADAVSLFFVLSGLVLSYKYLQPADKTLKLNYPAFAVQRIFRLYPAYLITVLLMFLYLYHKELNFQFIVNALTVNNYKVIEELTMINNTNHTIYSWGWSLGIEMVLSLFVPMFIIVAKYHPQLMKYFAIASLFTAFYIIGFLFHFLLGVMIAQSFEKIQQFDFKKSKLYKWRFLIYSIIFILFSVRYIDKISPLGAYYILLNKYLYLDFFTITAVASALIIIVVINNERLQRILHLKPLIYLGKISYSMYLVHPFIVFWWVIYWHPSILNKVHSETATYLIILFLDVFFTLLFATIMYYTIEKPFNNWGKSVSRIYFT